MNHAYEQLHRFSESEENYRIIVDNIADLVVLINPRGLMQYVSPSHEKALGYPIDELINMSPDLFLHPEDRDRFVQISIELLQTNGTVETTVRLVSKDGRVLWLDALFISVLNSNGQLRSIVCRGKDVTDRQAAEQALLENGERYRLLVQLCPLPIGLYKDNIITYVNNAALKLAGAESEKKIVGRLISDFVHPKDVELHNKEPLNAERRLQYRLLDLKGNIIDIDSISILLQNGSSFFILQDVTTSKKVEAIMKDSEQYYRRLVELSPLSIGTHLNDELIYLNPSGIKLLGVESMDDVLGRSIYDIMPRESQQKVMNYKSNLVNGHSQPPLEVEIYSKLGERIDVEAVGSYDDLTHMVQFMLNDITIRRKSEIALRESREQYLQLQNSLDHFSRDVFEIVSISELENHLVKEVKNILETEYVAIIEWSAENGLFAREGNHRLSVEHESYILQLEPDHIMQNELIAIDQSWLIRIGESRGKHVLMYISGTSMLKHHAQHVWLRTLTRFVNVLYDNFRVIEELSIELKEFVNKPTSPPWLLRMFFNLSENERKRLSQALHDSALQEQIVWYRRLELLNLSNDISADVKLKITNIMEGLLDVIYQIRVTCNELRPPL